MQKRKVFQAKYASMTGNFELVHLGHALPIPEGLVIVFVIFVLNFLKLVADYIHQEISKWVREKKMTDLKMTSLRRPEPDVF